MTGSLVLGLLRTAGLDVALPLAALREVVPCPPRLADLAVEHPVVLGALSLRGSVVPVVDPARLLGREAPRRSGQVVVVLAAEGRLLGLLVDEVRGLATVPVASLSPVAASEDLLVAHAFHSPTDGHVVNLLDPAALLARPGVVSVEDRPVAGVPGTEAGGRPLPLAVVRCGGTTLALPVAAVSSIVPTPRLVPSPADGPVCLGVTQVAGADLAVVDLLAALGLGTQRGAPLDCGLVLDLPAGRVVLGVGAMVGLHDVPRGAVVPLPAGASSSDLLREVAQVDGVGPCLLVDPAALTADQGVVALGRLTSTADDTGSADDGPATDRTGPPHLACTAGVDLAVPLDQVAEVLPFPDDLLACGASGGALGVVLHRGEAVPVHALSGLLGRGDEPYTATSRLLLVHADGAPVAWAVRALHAITPLAWSDPRPRDRGEDPLHRWPLVRLAERDGLVPQVDLVGLARALRGAAPVQVPPPRGAREPAAAQ